MLLGYCESFDDPRGFIDMLPHPDRGTEDVAHDALPIDHIGHATGQDPGIPRDAPLAPGDAVLVAKELERQAVRRSEGSQFGYGVRADADDFRAEVLERFVVVTEGARLGGAAGGARFRIKVDYDHAACIIGEADDLATSVGKLEPGGGGADLHGDLRILVHYCSRN